MIQLSIMSQGLYHKVYLLSCDLNWVALVQGLGCYHNNINFMEYIVHGSKNQIDNFHLLWSDLSETNTTFRSADYRSWSRIGCL